jgi:hypothetical protein
MEISMNDKYASIIGVWLCLALILIAVVSRLLPHPPNFTPLAAVGLFSGAYLHVRKLWLVPVTALLFSDMLIGFYHPIAMVFVYCGIILCAYIGRACLHERYSLLKLGGATLSGALIFFVLSNLGDWLTGLNYPLTLHGLLDCYVMAIPFFRNTLLGDLFYVTCLFGIYELFSRISWNLRTVRGA